MTEPSQVGMDQEIQRLIDRELDDTQRMQLLQRIEQEAPEAWRTVALGYVEAELMRSVFEEGEGEKSTEKVVSISSERPRSNRLRTVAIAAAAVILGVLIGAGVPFSNSSAPEETLPIAEEQ